MKAKMIVIEKATTKKIEKPNNKEQNKMSFFSNNNSQNLFAKILGIGPWLSGINLCEGHGCGSSYRIVRLSHISPEIFAKKY